MSIEDYQVSEEIKRFERETGVVYEDFSNNLDTINTEPNTFIDGKTDEEISVWKDMGYSACAGFKDFVRSMGRLGFNLGYGVAGLVENGEWASASEQEAAEEGYEAGRSYESKTLAGDLTYGLTKAGAGMATGGTALKAVGLIGKGGLATKAITNVARFAKSKNAVKFGEAFTPVLTGMAGDGLAFWQDEENLSNFLQENIDNPIAKAAFDFLSIDDDDGGLERAFKQSVEGAFTGAFADAVIKCVKYAKNGIKGKYAMKKLANAPKPKNLKEYIGDSAKVLAEEVKSMREVQPENYLQLKNKALKKFAEHSEVDFSQMDTAEVRKFMESADREVEKVAVAIHNQEKTSALFIDKMKELRESVNVGNINDVDRDKVMFEALGELGNAVAAVQDAAAESGKALGYASKSSSYRDIKKALNNIFDNADEIDKKALYDALSTAQTPAELAAKVDALVGIGEKMTKKGSKLNKWIAASQAGLMSHVGTIMKNVYTGAEMIFGGSADDLAAGMIGKTRSFVKDMLGKGGSYTSKADMAQGVYFFKNFMDNAFDVVDYGLQRLKKNTDIENPVAKFRRRMDNKKTYLPPKVGQTFDESSKLGRMANAWMRYSGVGISEGIDDFMGDVFYRTEATSLAADYADRIAKSEGLSKIDRDALYERTLNNALDINYESSIKNFSDIENAMFDDLAVNSIRKKATDYSLKHTFRGGEGAITKTLVNVMNGWGKPAKILIPFIKTASIITLDRFVTDRTLLGLISPQKRALFWKGLTSGGREADRVVAQQLIGNGLLLSGAGLFTGGYITGDYPQNANERAAWKAKGIQPNSIMIKGDNGEIKYISIDGYGPLSMCLKYGAKIAQVLSESPDDLSASEDFANAMLVYGITIGGAAINETAFRYMGDFIDGIKMSDFESLEKIKEKVANMATTAALAPVPRYIEQTMSLFDDDEKAMQTADTFMEKVKKKFGIDTSDSLDLFGRPVDAKEQWVGPLAGFNIGKSSQDIVIDEMLRNEIFLEAPSRKMNLGEVPLELTPDEVYLVKQKIGEDKTYERLAKDMKTPSYKLLTNDKKADLIRGTYNRAKNSALRWLIDSSVDVRKKYDKAKKALGDEPVLRKDVQNIINVPTLDE